MNIHIQQYEGIVTFQVALNCQDLRQEITWGVNAKVKRRLEVGSKDGREDGQE